MFCKLLVAAALIPAIAWCQIEESAEVFLEAYTDEFQEYFFEGLKQRGIENYDRAVEAFLKCKSMDPASPVVDHEIAKSYLMDRQLIKAEGYARDALMAAPENTWYLDTFVRAVLQQGYSLNRIKENVPYTNDMLRANLARILYNNNKFEEALEVISDIQHSVEMEVLKTKAMDSLKTVSEPETAPEEAGSATIQGNSLLERLKGLAASEDYPALEKAALEGTETYPAQPVYYFYHGKALRALGESQRAIRSLETGLDFIIDNWELRNEIYRELAAAYTELGNSSKANTYLSKIKTGL